MEHKSQYIEKGKKSFLSFFIKNSKIAFLAAGVILIWGASSAFLIPKESAPNIEYGIAVISTFYNGASSKDIDKLVTQEIENKIKDITDVSKITSTSRNSFSTISVEFETDTDMTKTMGTLRSKIDEAKNKLPQDCEDPNIIEIDSSMQPLFTVHLTGDLHPALLRDYAEKIKNYLEQDSNVREINISGGAEREIFVDIDPLRLAQYKISLDEVTSTIQSTHRDFPVGDLEIDKINYSLRFQGQHKNDKDIANIVLKTIQTGTQSSTIKISDIAQVYESSEETSSIESFTNLASESKERVPTIKLSIQKSNNTNIFTVDPYIRGKIIDYANKNFGTELQIYFTNEKLEHTRDSYDTVVSSGISSVIIVFLLLMFFIGIKEALAASVIIPLSFLVTIGATKAMGGTLNFMVNFSLILSLGILVDTSIVIVEGIYEGIKAGHTPKEAAMAAIQEFKAPLISGTLTTLSVFIPLLVLPGIMGKYLSFIPLSVSITLTASLIISLIIIPAIAASILKARKDRKQSERNILGQWMNNYFKKKEKFIEKLQNSYQAFTTQKLKSKGWRFISIYGTLFLCFMTFLLPVKFIMFPSDDQGFLYINTKLPEGTVKEKTLEATLPVEKILIDYPEVKQFETSISGNTSSITLELFKKKEREAQGLKSSLEIAEELRLKFKNFQNYEVSISEPQGGPPSESPVAFKIIAQDADLLPDAQKVAQDLKEILTTIPGTDNVKDDLTNLPGEITYHVNREEALRLGLRPESIAFLARTAIEGSSVITLTREGREIDVNVRYQKDAIQTFDDIDNIQILSNTGKSISLSQVLTREFNSAVSEIKRVNRKIAVTVSSQLTAEGNALEITNAMKEKIKNYQFPEGISLEDSGENAANTDLLIAMGIGFLIALFLMFTILVIQFNSYSYPFIILFTIIMSLLGVNTGLFLTGTPRSLAFLIGFISLAGIVVNDAIILVDRINNLRIKYPERPLEDVIAFAGSSRLQPIVLTTLTTAAGVAPLIFVDTFWAGLSYTVIFGLMVASTLTLFVTPAMYYQFTKEMHHIAFRIPLIILGITTIALLFSQQFLGALLALLIFMILLYLYKRCCRKHAQNPLPITTLE